jgi:hypothetical protein
VTRPQASHCVTRSAMACLVMPALSARSVSRSPASDRWRVMWIWAALPCRAPPGWTAPAAPPRTRHELQHARIEAAHGMAQQTAQMGLAPGIGGRGDGGDFDMDK